MKSIILFLVLSGIMAIPSNLDAPSTAAVFPEAAPAPVPVPAPIGFPVETRNVWRITIFNGDMMGHGTAFPIACEPAGQFWRITFLTAGHCVEEGSGYVADHEDGRRIAPGRALAVHPDYAPTEGTDVGVLVFISFFPVQIRELDFDPPVWGEKIYVCGYPSGEGPFLTEGLVSGDNRISASAYPGSSGSPVCRGDGRVCGILVAGYGDGFQFIDFMTLQAALSESEAWVRMYQ